MRKFLTGTGVFFAGAATMVATVAITQTTRNQLRTDAAQFEDTVQGQIETVQDEYFSKHGRYWQGMPTHTDPVEASSDLRKTATPTDQPESWQDVGIVLPAKSRFTTRVDTYDGPNGHGYTITTETKSGEEICTMIKNYGSETYREQAWLCSLPSK